MREEEEGGEEEEDLDSLAASVTVEVEDKVLHRPEFLDRGVAVPVES